jgi:diguanylate cyclase (GGDEF)-like protein
MTILLEVQKMQEDVTLMRVELNKATSLALSLKQRIESYKQLKFLIENLNQQMELKNLADNLLDSLFSLMAKRRGNCILYLVDPGTHKLNVFAARKEEESMVIKAKEGDIFDLWVVRHTSSLLVEDSQSDFRFDFEIIEKTAQRKVRSLISSPLISQERLLGIIRLDSPLSNVYDQEDLRLLNTIADSVAVAIENTKLLQEIKELVITDDLTGCFTKNYFMERIREELLKSIKEKKNLSLLMLDIDHFKEYNDKFGHIAGDIVLKELGRLLNKIIGTKGMVFRFGGEEFCVLLPDTDKQSSIAIAQRILEEVRKRVIYLRRHRTSITVSIGIASSPQDAILEDELISKADYYLYQAKQGGRDRLCYI